MSPAGKPRQCTHVRLSTTLSSPSRSAQYSTPVSVIAYTSRSLRTSPGILDLEENRTPNLIFPIEQRDETRRRRGKEQGRGGWTTQICSPVCLEEARLSFNHSQRKWGFCSSYFCLFMWYTDTMGNMVVSLIRSHNALQFIGCFFVFLLKGAITSFLTFPCRYK